MLFWCVSRMASALHVLTPSPIHSQPAENIEEFKAGLLLSDVHRLADYTLVKGLRITLDIEFKFALPPGG